MRICERISPASRLDWLAAVMLDGVMLASTLFVLTIALPFVQSEHALILEKVYLNGIGPLRMAIDTGAQSTTVTPLAAGRIGLKPQFRVEYATPTGTRLVGGGYTRVQTGGSEVSQVETIIWISKPFDVSRGSMA